MNDIFNMLICESRTEKNENSTQITPQNIYEHTGQRILTHKLLHRLHFGRKRIEYNIVTLLVSWNVNCVCHQLTFLCVFYCGWCCVICILYCGVSVIFPALYRSKMLGKPSPPNHRQWMENPSEFEFHAQVNHHK